MITAWSLYLTNYLSLFDAHRDSGITERERLANIFEILETIASCQLSIRKACRIPISPKTIYNILKAQASSEATAEALKKAVEKSNGVPPQVVVTDNGSAVVNLKGKKLTAFQPVCSELGMNQRPIPGGHPQSIGRMERFYGTVRQEEISLHRYSKPEEARQRIRVAIERYSTQRYHQGIGDIKAIERHEGREQEIAARREELFSNIKRNGRKPKVLTSV